MSAPTVADRLAHIADAIDSIARFTRGKTEAEFSADPMLRDAVERNLERLSEASRHVPDDLKALRPDIPWRQIADLGNALRHAYDRIATPRIWAIVVDDLAPLRASVETLLGAVDRRT